MTGADDAQQICCREQQRGWLLVTDNPSAHTVAERSLDTLSNGKLQHEGQMIVVSKGEQRARSESGDVRNSTEHKSDI